MLSPDSVSAVHANGPHQVPQTSENTRSCMSSHTHSPCQSRAAPSGPERTKHFVSPAQVAHSLLVHVPRRSHDGVCQLSWPAQRSNAAHCQRVCLRFCCGLSSMDMLELEVPILPCRTTVQEAAGNSRAPWTWLWSWLGVLKEGDFGPLGASSLHSSSLGLPRSSGFPPDKFN